MGNNIIGENFCNCENNDSRFEASFRTSPNLNNSNTEPILCPLFHTVIYQNYTIDNKNNNKQNKKIRNRNSKSELNNYEMNFEYHTTKKYEKDIDSYKNRTKGIFNLEPIKDDNDNDNNNENYISEKKLDNSLNDININNNEIIDNYNYTNNKDENINILKENNINIKTENLDSNIKIKNNSSDNSCNSDAPTTNIEKPNKPLNNNNEIIIQNLGKNTYFIGYVQENIRDGIGKMVSGVDIYQGEFHNDQANGYGIYKKNLDEIIYEGYWLNDEQNKYGIEKWKDGSAYIGEYFKQNKNGIGIYLWTDGSSYEGEFKDNMFDGYGIYFYKKNKIYLGEWKNNKKNGYGEFILDDKLYIGNYLNDLRCGFGINYLKNEDKIYIGFWKNNKRCGFGKIFSENKFKYGIWPEINEENKKTQWFNNEQDAMEYLNKSEFGNKYKKFFECDKDELIKSYEIYFKEDFVDLCFLSDNLKK